MSITPLLFLLGCLATYRLSLMISREAGPASIFRKLRNLPPPKSSAREGLQCFYCNSIWWSTPTTYLFWHLGLISNLEIPLYFLAFSAGAIIIHRQWTKDF